MNRNRMNGQRIRRQRLQENIRRFLHAVLYLPVVVIHLDNILAKGIPQNIQTDSAGLAILKYLQVKIETHSRHTSFASF